jgi:hypothetical protein
MAMKRSAGPPRRSRSSVDFGELLAKYSLTLLKVATLLFVAAVGYYVYALFSGGLKDPATASDARVISNLLLCGQVLTIAGTLATLALVIVTLDEVAYAIIVAVAALGLIFGTPAACGSAGLAGQPVTKLILSATATTGEIMLAIVGLRLLLEIYLQIRNAPKRRAEEQARLDADGPRKVKLSQGTWSKCWQLPYCHDTVKEMCPAFKAHKTCWKFGTGCNCDVSMIESIIRGGGSMGKGGAKDSHKRSTAEAYIRSDLEADLVKPGSGEKTIPCAKCPIYNEHQRQKFRIVNPIAVVATIAALVALYQPVTVMYKATIGGMAEAAARLSVTGHVDASEWFRYLDTDAVRIFFFIVVGLLALSYVLKLVEWAVLEKKW